MLGFSRRSGQGFPGTFPGGRGRLLVDSFCWEREEGVGVREYAWVFEVWIWRAWVIPPRVLLSLSLSLSSCTLTRRRRSQGSDVVDGEGGVRDDGRSQFGGCAVNRRVFVSLRRFGW